MDAAFPERREAGRFVIFYYSSLVEPASLIRSIGLSKVIARKGRAGIRIVEEGGLRLVVRAYRHGGLFRSFTGSFFLNAGRVTSEAGIMHSLREAGFPVAAPFAAVIERHFLLKRLYLVTVFEENALSLLEYLQKCKKRERARSAVRLAGLLWRLEQAGVYHRDLHPGNVLVTRENRFILLDFDRAAMKTLLKRDVASMIRRLNRFVDKMEEQGLLHVGGKEKALFMRAYERLSGCDMTSLVTGGQKARGYMHRLGWFIESVLFRGKK